MADQAVHQFGNISLGSRGAVNVGLLKLSSAGLSWRRQQGNKVVDVRKDDIAGLVWTRLGSRGCQLGVRRGDGPTVNFLGFKDKDHEAVAGFCRDALGMPLAQQELSVAGRNWGSVALHGASLAYSAADGKPLFEVPLPDVAQAQQTRDEVMLEFHADDTAGDDKEDTLIELAFHVPPTNEHWAAEAEAAAVAPDDGAAAPPAVSAAKALVDALLQHTDAGVATTDDAVAVFDDVHVLAPRGRFAVELHPAFLKMVGQTQDFKIRYASVNRLFILPRSSAPHTLVVVGLDPPIRKGQTFYSFLLCQFNNDDEISVELDISDELLAQKNEKCGGKLQKTLAGPLHTVFAHALRGMSGAKITRAKLDTFRNAAGDGCAVRCSFKADDGYLYPLERAFFYVNKPPMCIQHGDIECVEFQRQGGGVVSSSVRTFDLLVRQRSNNTEYQFRNIQRSEWEPLFAFITAKKIRVENLAEARAGPKGPGAGIDLGDDLDAGLRAAAAEADDDDDDEEDEDEDFDAGAASGGSGSGSGSDSGGSGSGSDDDDDASGSSDAEMVDEAGIGADDVLGGGGSGGGGGGKKRKASGGGDGGGEAAPKAPKPKKQKAKPAAAADGADGADGEEGGPSSPAAGGKKKAARKKKDPNAPKKALSGFMYFSSANRERIKAANPEAAFGELGKLLGEEWRGMGPEQRAPYEEKAAKDKERYAAAMAEYRGGSAAAAAGGGGGGGGAADEEEEEGGGGGAVGSGDGAAAEEPAAGGGGGEAEEEEEAAPADE